ncbi:MAG: hypothetical protein ACK4RM_04090, partial [Flavobacterium sp.]
QSQRKYKVNEIYKLFHLGEVTHVFRIYFKGKSKDLRKTVQYFYLALRFIVLNHQKTRNN